MTEQTNEVAIYKIIEPQSDGSVEAIFTENPMLALLIAGYCRHSKLFQLMRGEYVQIGGPSGRDA